jgi:hypothetical protein
MGNNDVKINVDAQFQSSGADRVKADFEGIRESAASALEAMNDFSFTSEERMSAASAIAAQQNQELKETLLQLGQYQGSSYVDISRQAASVGDVTNAVRARQEAIFAGERLPPVGELGPALERYFPLEDEAERHRSEFGHRRLYSRVENMVTGADVSSELGRFGTAARNVVQGEHFLEQLRALEGNSERVRELTEALGRHRTTIEEEGKRKGENYFDFSDDSKLDKFTQALAQQGLGGLGSIPGGGMLGRAAGALGGARVLGPLAVVGGAALGINWLMRNQQTALDEGGQWLDLSRELGTSDPMMEQYVDPSNYMTRPEIGNLYFSSSNAAGFLQNYGMPRDDLFDVATSGLALSRYTGSDPGNIASLLRSGTQAGVLNDGGLTSPERFANTLFTAVKQGIQDGVSASETFQSIEKYFASASGAGLTTSAASVQGFLSLLDNLRTTGSKALSGEAGAQAARNLLEGLSQGGNPGQDMMLMSVLSEGGSLPSSEGLGLPPEVAQEYEKFRTSNPLLAFRFLQEQIKTSNPAILSRIGTGLTKMFGSRPDLEYQFLTSMGLSYEDVATMRVGMGGNSAFNNLAFVHASEPEAMSDPQAQNAGNFGVELGLRDQRNKYLDEETKKLISVSAATADFTDTLKELGTAMSGKVSEAALNLRGFFYGEGGPLSASELPEGQQLQTEFKSAASSEFAKRMLLTIPGIESQGQKDPYRVVNPDSGALGKFQIMPSNIVGPNGDWDRLALNGKDISIEEFLNSPEYQNAIAEKQFELMYEDLMRMNSGMPLEEQVVRAGAGWLRRQSLDDPWGQLDDYDDANGTTPLEHGQDNWRKYKQLFGPTSSLPSDNATASVQEIRLTIQGDGKIMVVNAPPGLVKAADAFNDEVAALMYPRGNPLNQKRG